MRKTMLIAGVLALGATASAYQYEISGYPPSTAKSTSSSTCQVQTGRARQPRGIATLESRFRTTMASEAIKILTTPFGGACIIVR